MLAGLLATAVAAATLVSSSPIDKNVDKRDTVLDIIYAVWSSDIYQVIPGPDGVGGDQIQANAGFSLIDAATGQTLWNAAEVDGYQPFWSEGRVFSVTSDCIPGTLIFNGESDDFNGIMSSCAYYANSLDDQQQCVVAGQSLTDDFITTGIEGFCSLYVPIIQTGGAWCTPDSGYAFSFPEGPDSNQPTGCDPNN